MYKKLNIGDEVLVFSSKDKIYPCSKGIVVKNDIVLDDYSLLGRNQRIIYGVQCGEEYICGGYNNDCVNNIFFRTVEDHVEFLKRLINCNLKSINDMIEESNEYIAAIDSLGVRGTPKKLKKLKI